MSKKREREFLCNNIKRNRLLMAYVPWWKSPGAVF
jgi:hypothetical protein